MYQRLNTFPFGTSNTVHSIAFLLLMAREDQKTNSDLYLDHT